MPSTAATLERAPAPDLIVTAERATPSRLARNRSSSWFAISPYSGFMHPIMGMTNWLIDPIRRLLPPTGMIDFSPMVAWIALWLARNVLMGML